MITVCLATYNGEKYLKEQIESLLNQTYKEFQILALDDCSTDSTINILKFYNIKTLEIEKNNGPSSSFSTLLSHALNDTKNHYFMFCDQDDIWEKDKIEKEYKLMKEQESLYPNTPLLIHTDLTVVNENLEKISDSFIKYQNLNPSQTKLNKLLLQNIITGCTIMINRELALLSSPFPKEVIMHDWWIALVATTFGRIFYLPEATIKYRQHNSNKIGAKGFNIQYILSKIDKKHTLQKNYTQTTLFRKRYKNDLTTKEQDILDNFISLQNSSFLKKRVKLFKYQFFKHGFIRNIGLFFKI